MFDTEPMPNIRQRFFLNCLRLSFFYTNIDLSKDYWQVTLTEQARDMISFETSISIFLKLDWRSNRGAKGIFLNYDIMSRRDAKLE